MASASLVMRVGPARRGCRSRRVPAVQPAPIRPPGRPRTAVASVLCRTGRVAELLVEDERADAERFVAIAAAVSSGIGAYCASGGRHLRVLYPTDSAWRAKAARAGPFELVAVVGEEAEGRSRSMVQSSARRAPPR